MSRPSVPIEVAGKVSIAAPRDQVWELLFDIETMKRIVGRIPGITVERLEQRDALTYETSATVTVAIIRGKYDGTITVLEQNPPELVRVRGEGQGGGNSTEGQVSLHLTPIESGTEMVYDGQGNLYGPLAKLGQRLVDTVGRQFIEEGAKLLAAEIGVSHVARAAPQTMIGLTFDVLFALLVLISLLVLVIALSIKGAG